MVYCSNLLSILVLVIVCFQFRDAQQPSNRRIREFRVEMAAGISVKASKIFDWTRMKDSFVRSIKLIPAQTLRHVFAMFGENRAVAVDEPSFEQGVPRFHPFGSLRSRKDRQNIAELHRKVIDRVNATGTNVEGHGRFARGARQQFSRLLDLFDRIEYCPPQDNRDESELFCTSCPQTKIVFELSIHFT